MPKRKSRTIYGNRLAAHRREKQAVERRLEDGGLSPQKRVHLESRLQKLNVLIPTDQQAAEQAASRF